MWHDNSPDDSPRGVMRWLDESAIFIGVLAIIGASGWTGYKLATAFAVCA